MSHFVLVPGANHGGWWYEPLVRALSDAGHDATAITLSGLDPDGPPAPEATLDTHVAEVEAVLRETGHPVVLVGHSYGGSVITGAADARPEAVSTLIYLDAFVPDDGDTCFTMTNDWEREWYIDGCKESGLGVEPLPFFDERARPHPVGTLLQRSRLTGAWRRVPRKHYVVAADPEWLAESPMRAATDKVRADPQFDVIDAPSTHNFLRDGPDLLLRILLDLDTGGD